jgi:hypothetical protein
MQMEPNTSTALVPTKKGGRPPSARNKKTLWVEEMLSRNGKDVRKFIETIKRKAIVDEDPDFAKMWLDRIAPVRKGALLRFPLPEIRTMDDVKAALDGLLQATSQGLISSAEAVELSNVVDKLRQAIGDLDTDRRLAALEAAEERRLS